MFMKLSRISITLLGVALLSSSGAIAGDVNKGSVQIAEKLTVEGKRLNPGRYTVEWDGAGPTVQVTLLQGKETVATFPAHITEQAAKNTADAYGSIEQPDGSRSLTAIYLAGKRAVLEVQQNGTSQESSSPGSK